MSRERTQQEDFAAFALRVRGSGFQNTELLEAFEKSRRTAFIDPRHASVAWSRGMIPIGCGQTIEGADLQLRVLSLLELQADNRVLEIGTGSGFTAAVMSRCVDRVLTVERFSSLSEAAGERLQRMERKNVYIRHGLGFEAVEQGEGPFDRIVVWSAFGELPRRLVDWMASGAIAIIAVGPPDAPQKLLKLVKIGARFDRSEIDLVRFQPLATRLPTTI